MDEVLLVQRPHPVRSHGISVAPRGRSESRPHAAEWEAVGVITFDAPNIAGRLTLSVPRFVFTCPSLFKMETPPVGEWTRELTNQLMGRIKNRLIQFQLELRTHIPTVFSGAAFELQKKRILAEGELILFD
jgi:hypothetical protein